MTIQKVDITKIKPNPYQPDSRLEIPDDVAEKFGKSILEYGLLQTPVARYKDTHAVNINSFVYEMGDGWLRLSGFKWLVKQGHKEFQEMQIDVRELTDRQMADLVLEANSIRKDLNPIEKAKLFSKYLCDFKCGQTELAREHNISQGELSNTLRLLDLPGEIQQKVISQEISETHARTLLQLDDEKKIATFCKRVTENHYSVADLDRSIKSELWNNTLPLYEESSWNNEKPLFDLKECGKCEHRQLLGNPWIGDKAEKKPRCNNKKCWKEKQEAALQEQNKKLLEDLSKKGITKLVQYDYQTMTYFTGNEVNRKECKNCEKKAASKSPYRDSVDILCLDKKCYEKLENEKRKADKHARELEDKKTEEFINKAFENIDTGNPGVIEACIECLMRSYGEYRLDAFAKAFNINIDDEEDDFIELFLEEVLKIPSAKILPRLCFEILRDTYSCDKETEKQILYKFQGKVKPEKNFEEPALKTYRIQNRINKEWAPDTEAASADEACRKHGWQIDGCYVREKTKAGGWKNVTSEKGALASLPAGVRRCEDVPDKECSKCNLNTEDHTIGHKFRDGNTSYKVCVKDYRAVMKQSNPDPLAGLEIRTANEEYDFHQFKLGGLFAYDSELKGCVCKLGQRANWGTDLNQILVKLKTFPQSHNRDLLIGILEGKEPVKV